ncbi:GT2 family glycosyltransferase [Variovorax boronicumulans]|uniref:glycosyltransferase family 2 protein n=1 Tax=Variovorax boronicumulans TaxID=436515 RepID=UPI003391AF22
MTTPLVTIIVVNWNVRELLHGCLKSVFEQGGLAADAMQVIVVDNASHDDSAQMVRTQFPQVQLIANNDNVGFGRANNQALIHCAGPYVLLLNPDTVVEQGAIAGLVQAMDAEPDVSVIGCRLLNGDRTLQRWTGGAYPRLLNLVNHYFFLDRLLPSAWRPLPLYLDRDVRNDMDVDWVSGACMMLRASALDGRLFNTEYFMYGEDMELCHRLKKAGGRVVYSPRISIIHFQGESMKKQEGDVLLSSLKGPRQFYRQMRGGRALHVYDAVTVAGFALRWLLFRVAGLVRPGASFDGKARSSRDMMRRAWAILRQG